MGQETCAFLLELDRARASGMCSRVADLIVDGDRVPFSAYAKAMISVALHRGNGLIARQFCNRARVPAFFSFFLLFQHLNF